MFSHLNNVFTTDLEPSEFYLSPNYPNPFDKRTSIKYCVPYRTRVLMTVYNEINEEITKLVDEVKNPGTYEVEFNASALPRGNYSYQLKAEEFIETKKMILLK